MAWRGSVSRSLMSNARAAAFRSSPPVAAARLRPPPLSAPRRFFFSNRREDREGWVMSAALPDTQMQDPDATLYLKFIHGPAHLVCEDMRFLHVGLFYGNTLSSIIMSSLTGLKNPYIYFEAFVGAES